MARILECPHSNYGDFIIKAETGDYLADEIQFIHNGKVYYYKLKEDKNPL